ARVATPSGSGDPDAAGGARLDGASPEPCPGLAHAPRENGRRGARRPARGGSATERHRRTPLKQRPVRVSCSLLVRPSGPEPWLAVLDQLAGEVDSHLPDRSGEPERRPVVVAYPVGM